MEGVSLVCAGALLSWSIVVYKSLGVPSLSRTYVHRAAMDENVQYLVVAGYWFFNKPIYGASPDRTRPLLPVQRS